MRVLHCRQRSAAPAASHPAAAPLAAATAAASSAFFERKDEVDASVSHAPAAAAARAQVSFLSSFHSRFDLRSPFFLPLFVWASQDQFPIGVESLVNMGFDRADAVEALQSTHGDVPKACHILVQARICHFSSFASLLCT